MDGFHRGFERLIELESQLSSDKHNRDIFSVSQTALCPLM